MEFGCIRSGENAEDKITDGSQIVVAPDFGTARP